MDAHHCCCFRCHRRVASGKGGSGALGAALRPASSAVDTYDCAEPPQPPPQPPPPPPPPPQPPPPPPVGNVAAPLSILTALVGHCANVQVWRHSLPAGLSSLTAMGGVLVGAVSPRGLADGFGRQQPRQQRGRAAAGVGCRQPRRRQRHSFCCPSPPPPTRAQTARESSTRVKNDTCRAAVGTCKGQWGDQEGANRRLWAAASEGSTDEVAAALAAGATVDGKD